MSLTLLFNVPQAAAASPPVTPPPGVTPGIFPAMPNALDPYQVTLSYRTDVIAAYQDQEQRVQLRRIPRLRQSYVARALTPVDMARLDAMAAGLQAQQWVLPYWPHGTQLTAPAGPGAATLLCDTADRDFVVGGTVVLWQDSGTAESATITSLASGQVGATLVNAWGAGTYVFPARLARWANDVRARRIMRGGADATVTFDFEGLVDPGVATPDPALFTVGYPDRYRQEPEDSQRRSIERFDSPTGTFADYTRGASPLGRYQVAWHLATKADVNALLTWYYGQKGALAPFYFPTRQPDLPLALPVGAADTTITITRIGYTADLFPLASRRRIALAAADGTLTQRTITAAADNGDGTETLTLDAAAGVAVPVTGTVCFVLYVRLSDDPITVAWVNGNFAETTLDVSELREALEPTGTQAPALDSPQSPSVTPSPAPAPAPQPGATQPPTADANGPYAAIAGNAVLLSALGSSDPYGGVTVQIDPGDGSGYQAAPSLTLTHVYVAGSYTMRVKVTSTTTGLSSTASAAVTITAAGTVTVAGVVVSPSSLAGQVGGVGRPIAKALDAAGNDITGSVTVSWTTDNPSVVAAPADGPTPTVTYLAAGSANLVAHAGTAASPNVPVTVTAVVTSSGLTPNLPAGYALSYVTDLHALPDGIFFDAGATIRDLTTYAPGGGVTTPANPPGSPPFIAEAVMPAGFKSGNGAGAVWASGAAVSANGWTHLYLMGIVQVSSNFYGDASGCNKIFIANIHNAPCFILSATGSGKGALAWQARLQDLGIGANGVKGSAINLNANLASAPVTRGLWQRPEIELIANTPGTANGVIRLWLTNYDAAGRPVSGPTKVMEYTNVGWSSATQAAIWQGAGFSVIWGGDTGKTVPATQYVWCDHLAIGGKA